MYNWSIDEKRLKKKNPKEYEIWCLAQIINYGKAGEKIDEKLVRKHWKLLKNRLDPAYRNYLELLLWPKKKTS